MYACNRVLCSRQTRTIILNERFNPLYIWTLISYFLASNTRNVKTQKVTFVNTDTVHLFSLFNFTNSHTLCVSKMMGCSISTAWCMVLFILSKFDSCSATESSDSSESSECRVAARLDVSREKKEAICWSVRYSPGLNWRVWFLFHLLALCMCIFTSAGSSFLPDSSPKSYFFNK